MHSGKHFTKLEGGGISCRRHGKIFKFESRKWHLQHSENTFCEKQGFQNTVLMVRFVINHMLSIDSIVAKSIVKYTGYTF